MSDSWGKPWSNNPNAPQIPYFLHFDEKCFFAGVLIGAILYGVVISLFFQCMNALFDPANRATWGIKWGLLVHTMVTFSFVTIYTGVFLDLQSISWIDNREFPGSDIIPPGPVGYQFHILHEGISVVPAVMTLMNNWLGDGLLLYRCSVIYAMNYWAIASPGLVFLASLATGIAFIYQSSLRVSALSSYTVISNYGISYYSITALLNVLLTIMIITRLILQSRNIRNAMGGSTGATRTYTAVIVMIVESYALYTVTFLVFLGLWAAKNSAINAFFPFLVQVQAIAPFLITLRVANQNVMKSKTTVSGNDGSIHFRSHGKSADSNGTLPAWCRDLDYSQPRRVW